MTAPTCYRCNTTIADDNSSLEHILPNALGGRLKSRALLCKLCNSECGDTIDAALINQLMPLANALNIERERGEVPPVRVTLASGEQMRRDADGNMWPYDARPVVTENDGCAEFSIAGPSIKQTRKHVEGLKRKYPKLDVDAVMATARETTTPVNTGTTFEFPPLGGADAFRAVVKIAVGYYLLRGGSPDRIREAISTVVTDALPPVSRVGLLYAIDPIPARDNAVVTHVIALVTREDGRLQAYVELFSAFRFVVNLADTYSGPAIHTVYCYDVLARREVGIDEASLLDAPWTPEEYWDPDALGNGLEPVIAAATKRNQTAWAAAATPTSAEASDRST